jgi:2-isopropylmalate synthase
MPKYQPYRFPAKDFKRQWPDRAIEKAPIWCSVDLRDGNQALSNPMNIDQKVLLFNTLVKIGFKQIEVGFPSASQVEFDFTRRLIDENLIPDDVAIQILTQARRHLIERSAESLKGAKKVVVHLYNSTSEQQRRITFNKSKEEIKRIAVEGTRMVIEQLEDFGGCEIVFQYSPESFTGTENDYAVEVCEAVCETWDPAKRGKMIINLPATVELSTPNLFADKVEWFIGHFKRRPEIIVSIHAHNDRGTALAASELALLAGADRIEGTLFGNGERTGNMDIVNMALNMYTQGIDPELDFTDLPEISRIYEQCTGMTIPPRQPYAGELVFTAFSGSHQDAIKKGMVLARNKPGDLWDIPYLPIDPHDIGRTYKAIIRINSQSGKGGVAYVLEEDYGIKIPKLMQPDLGKVVNDFSEEMARELSSDEIYDVFEKQYLKNNSPYSLMEYDVKHTATDKSVVFNGKIMENGNEKSITGKGNGPIDAFMNALQNEFKMDLSVSEFEEQAIGSGTATEAAAYIALQNKSGLIFWGAGRDTDTSAAHFTAILNAINRYKQMK